MSSSDTETKVVTGRKPYLSGDDTRPFEAWDLPNVGMSDTAPKSDAFGYKERLGRPDEEEPENMMPPTMAELEQIRAEAEQEGFAEGKEQGYREGLEQGHTQGHEQGMTEGLEQGRQQGFDEGMQRSTEVLAKLESAMAKLQAPLALLDTEVEMELVKFSMMLAQSVVMAELKTHPEHVLTALRQGVDALPIKQQQVSIRVHPEDARRVGEAYSHSQLEKQGWEIESDPTLSEGDCLVQTQRSQVDLRLSERLAKVLAMPDEQLAELQRDYDNRRHELEASNQLSQQSINKEQTIDGNAVEAEGAAESSSTEEYVQELQPGDTPPLSSEHQPITSGEGESNTAAQADKQEADDGQQQEPTAD